jgi:basic membrane protein A
MKRIMSLLAVAALAVSLSSCATNTFEIAMITDIGSIDDKSFNQGTWEGVNQYAEDNNKTVKYYRPTLNETATLADQLAAIDLAVNGGAKVIVTPGFLFEEAIFVAQDKYPEVKFVLIDGAPRNADYSVFKTSDNTLSILFAEHESGFLAGYSVVKDGYEKLGFMGGQSVPPVKKFGFGFVAGAYYAAQEMGKLGTVSVPNANYEYLGTFSPGDTVRSTAAGWYNAGTQIIFAAAGGAGNSVMGAAAEATNKWVVGVDVNQIPQSEKVITAAMKEIGLAAYEAIATHYDGTWRGGYTKFYNAANNGVSIPNDFSRFNSYNKAAYDAIQAKVANGTVVVPETYAALKTFVTNLGVNTNDPNKFPVESNANAG